MHSEIIAADDKWAYIVGALKIIAGPKNYGQNIRV